MYEPLNEFGTERFNDWKERMDDNRNKIDDCLSMKTEKDDKEAKKVQA